LLNPTSSSKFSLVRAPQFLFLNLAGSLWLAWTLQAATPDPSRYQFQETPHPDGIGKLYFGREIAQVMGHQGAPWLERDEREHEEKPGLVIELLALRPGQVVADIGAGSGYYTRRLSRAVGPEGSVYAVDIQPEMLQVLTRNAAAAGITNVIPVLGSITNPNLPEAHFDLALLVDVYHEFSHPREMMMAICRALKPGGRLVLVEYRGEDPNVPIKELHKMTETQVRLEMTPLPLEWIRTNSERLPWQHFVEFRKR
jgi:ubiquinone/menaquinone biosynthesis C-methylase UbiE